MDAHTVEAVLSKRFRVERAPTLTASTPSKVPIAFTRLQCDGADHGRSGSVPAENAFAFQVLLKPMRSWEIWTDRGHAPLPPSGSDAVFLFDLSANPRLELHDAFDMVRCYISQSSLDSLAYEHDMPRIGGLQMAEYGTSDPVLHGMASALAASMRRPGEAQTMFVEHMALAFHAHVVHAYGGVSAQRRYSGCLTPRQLRRVCDAMLSDLSASHSIERLAGECGLSSSHFAHAFKCTTGLAPHQWLMRRRVERARELLAQTDIAIAEIALACGFVDQSHFSRVFARFAKQSPARWRRQESRQGENA